MTNPVQNRLKDLMIAHGLTLAVAESLTAGRLQAAIGEIPGASGFFLGGVTAYTLDQKVRLLGVDRAHAASVDCVSQRVAIELARGACTLFGSDIAAGTTGYAESAPDANVGEPMAYFAVCARRGGAIVDIAADRMGGPGLDRVEMQKHVAAKVVETIVAYLETVEESAS